MGAPAHAAPTLASPALFAAGPTPADAAACYVRNVGPKPVTLNVTIFNALAALPADFQNCNDAPLDPGRTCVVLVNDLPPGNILFSCEAEVLNGPARKLRGTMELRQVTPSGLRVMIAEDLR